MDTLQKKYNKDVTSQWGEDGIIEEIFRRIGTTEKFCIEFGAWDGKHYSNAWNLWHEHGWNALLIEGDAQKHKELEATTKSFAKVIPLNAYVEPNGENSLDAILERTTPNNKSIDLLSIDIDGNDYYIFEGLKIRPRVVIIEHNPTIPPHLSLVQKQGEYIGASARALCDLAHKKGYKLATATKTNLFFIDEKDFSKLGFEEPPLAEVFVPDLLTYVVSSFDGVLFLTKNPTFGTLHINPMRNRSFADPQENIVPVLIQRKGICFGIVRSYIKGMIIHIIKPFLKKTFLYQLYIIAQNWRRNTVNYLTHKRKELILNIYRRRFGLTTLVETGTYEGAMVDAMRKKFSKIYSIELSNDLARKATERFACYPHISILQGDSGVELPQVLRHLTSPALFWLDGHYSGGTTAHGAQATPIEQELRAIFQGNKNKGNGHVVLIDDARLFNGANGYPALDVLKKDVSSIAPNYQFNVSHDVIMLTPNRR